MERTALAPAFIEFLARGKLLGEKVLFAELQTQLKAGVVNDHGRFKAIVRGQDPAEPEEVHLARRADRQAGQGRRLDPGAADRHPALPLRRQARRRRRARAKATRRSSRRRRGRGRRQGQGRRGRGRARARGRGHARRARGDPRRGAAAPRTSPTRARARSSTKKDRYVGVRTSGPESRCATSSAPTSRRCAADRLGHLQPAANPMVDPDPRRPCATGRGRPTRAAPTRSSST
jgi:hypothetical protein